MPSGDYDCSHSMKDHCPRRPCFQYDDKHGAASPHGPGRVGIDHEFTEGRFLIDLAVDSGDDRIVAGPVSVMRLVDMHAAMDGETVDVDVIGVAHGNGAVTGADGGRGTFLHL